MNEYKIIILRERPELAPIAAEWFHCKWGVPTEAYFLYSGSFKRFHEVVASIRPFFLKFCSGIFNIFVHVMNLHSS